MFEKVFYSKLIYMMISPTTWIEISRSALDHNIAIFKRLLGTTLLMAVVKSNAYGHGMIEIAQFCQQHKDIAGFITVSLSEAYTLRQAGITKPIVVMGFLDRDLSYAITNNIHISVHDITLLQALEQTARALGTPASVHIKVDTGLTRFGFMPENVVSIAAKIGKNNALSLQGLCTHFAESSTHDWIFTAQQRTRFFNVVQALDQRKLLPSLYHADKTTSALRPAEQRGTAVRLGAGLYGLLPEQGLQQVLTWKTRIIHIRSLEAGIPIGYGRTYCTQSQKRIALIPIGYYDGYDRRLSNCGHVVIGYRTTSGIYEYARAPIIGLVAMNITTLDITHLPDVKIGDEVILLGDYPGIRSWDIAHLTGGGNPRDVTVKINPIIEKKFVA